MLVVLAVYVLAGCGQKDMSGTYYFNRSADAKFLNVGQLVLIKASDDGTKYKASEANLKDHSIKDGILQLNDKSYLDLNLSKNPAYVYTMEDFEIVDISNLQNEKYEFKNGVLKIGEVEFYSDQTKKGKELKFEGNS